MCIATVHEMKLYWLGTNILNQCLKYENIDRNIFSQSRKREGLEDMELH